MQKIAIALCSQKGGVGKTTLALNLGLALARLDHQVTIVELDPQGSLGASLMQERQAHAGLAEVLLGGGEVDEATVLTKAGGLSLVPVGDVELARLGALEAALVAPGRLGGLLGELQRFGTEVVLLDCPSGLGPVTLAALGAASHALVPLQAEPLSLRSVELVLGAIDYVRERGNPGLTLLGLVLSMFDRGSEASLAVAQASWQSFVAEAVLETVIPRDRVYLEASLHGVPVAFMAQGKHPEGRRFGLLAQEIVDRIEGPQEVHDGGPVQTLL